MPRFGRWTWKVWVSVAALAGLVAGPGDVPDAGAAAGGKPAGATCRRNCPDTTAPTVVVTAPGAGSTVGGVVAVTGSASDNVAVTSVQVALGNGPFSTASGTTSWSAAVDTTGQADGPSTIVTRALDASGNATVTSTPVTVDNAGDSTAPVVVVSSPAAGATVAGTFDISGSASDDTGVTSVTVAVDGGAPAVAEGTVAWAVTVDASTWSPGPHTIAARAADQAGNVGVSAISVEVVTDPPPGTGTDIVVADPNATNRLELLGRTRLPAWGPVTGVLASEAFTQRRVAWFRDSATGATSTLTLPVDSNQGWYELASVMSSASDLWLLGGPGPLTFRHYQLSGSPLPTSAVLVESRTFGDTDSRQGDLVTLVSGAVVVAWHQQGANGLPQGQHVAYRHPTTGWEELAPMAFMPTRSSNQVMAQHPADGSVWLFSDPDAWGNIGAVRLVEADGSLQVTLTDAYFISDEEFGLFGPDPENAFLAVAQDPAGSLALAYQSADRRFFVSGGQTLVGSRVAVARIQPDGSAAFVAGPGWAERVSRLGLVVRTGELIVSYRPVDETDMTFDDLAVSRYQDGQWEPPITLGTMTASSWTVGYGTGRDEFVATFGDGRIHFRTA